MLNIFTSSSFENHWNLLLRKFVRRREEEIQILTTHKVCKKHILSIKQNK